MSFDAFKFCSIALEEILVNLIYIGINVDLSKKTAVSESAAYKLELSMSTDSVAVSL